MKIGLLVDSSATANPIISKHKHIHVLPLHITGEGGFDMLDTAANIKKNQIYERLAGGETFKTSQASPGELAAKYDELLKKYNHIIHIPIPENLSSMLATAKMVANEDKYRGKVTVIHNRNLPAQGLRELVLRLESEIASGQLKTPQEVVDAYHHHEPKYYVAIIPGDLRNLAQGGRATKIASAVLNVFKTKVLIRWQAHPSKEGISRTVTNLADVVLRHANQLHHRNFDLIVTAPLHYNQKSLAMLREALDNRNIRYRIEEIPPLYPIHAGVNTIGFIVSPKK